MLQPGYAYYKSDIYSILHVPLELQRGAWDTGLRFYKDDAFVFANVTIAGRTGHNYNNHWDGDELIWFGLQSSHVAQPTIRKLLNPSGKIHVFTREQERGPFYYEGEATALRHVGERPVSIVWGFNAVSSIYPDEVIQSSKFREGSVKSVLVNRYERNIAARRACIAHYGPNCQVCSLNFSHFYGSIGIGFIHVHHINPIASIGKSYQLDPVGDLRPVCPNCHAMLHRVTPPLTIEELRQLLSSILG